MYIASGVCVCASVTVGMSAYNHMRVCWQQNRNESGNTIMCVCVSLCVCVCVHPDLKNQERQCETVHPPNDHTHNSTWSERCVNTAHSCFFGFFFKSCIFTSAPLKERWDHWPKSNKMKVQSGGAAWNSLLFSLSRWKTDVDKWSTWNIAPTPAIEALTVGLGDSGHTVSFFYRIPFATWHFSVVKKQKKSSYTEVIVIPEYFKSQRIWRPVLICSFTFVPL